MPETAIRFHGGIRDGTDEQVYAERTAGRWAFSWLQLGSSLGVGLPRRDTMAAGERDDHRSDSGPLRDVSGVFTKSDFKIDPSQLQFFGKVVLLIDPSQLQFFGKWCSSTGPRTPPTPRSPTGPQPVRHLHEGRGLDIERKKTSATSYRILVRGVDIDVLIGK